MFQYFSDYDASRTYDKGIITNYYGRDCIFDGETWRALCLSIPVEFIGPCKNCGAPVHEYEMCPYCGTRNKKIKNLTFFQI